ncbi:MAG: hypothetical protein JOY80_10865, partial [Candidatus Dormibacteraeota bacterium]|nr:hypothetical protein [Candidatus Dormibacteraeota bacterium]
KQLLSGAHPTARLLFPSGDAQRATAATMIAQQANIAGFALTPSGLSDSDFAAALSNGGFDAALVDVPLPLDPDDSSLFATGAPLNAGGYSSAAVDKLINSELAATSSSSMTLDQGRKSIFMQLEQTITSDLPMYFLWAPRHYLGLSAIVGGVTSTGAELDRDRDESFYVDWFLTA